MHCDVGGKDDVFPVWCGRWKRLMSLRCGKYGLQCRIRQILLEGFAWSLSNSICPIHNRHIRGERSVSTPVQRGDVLNTGKHFSQICMSVCCKNDFLSPNKIYICPQEARQRMSQRAFFVLWGSQHFHILPWILLPNHDAYWNLLKQHGQATYDGGNWTGLLCSTNIVPARCTFVLGLHECFKWQGVFRECKVSVRHTNFKYFNA